MIKCAALSYKGLTCWKGCPLNLIYMISVFDFFFVFLNISIHVVERFSFLSGDMEIFPDLKFSFIPVGIII